MRAAAILAPLALVALASPPTAQAPRESTVGEHGLRVWEFPGSTGGSFHMVVHVGVGSRDEPDDLAGISHFLEHCLFRSTELRSSSEMLEAVRDRGGHRNGLTNLEWTNYFLTVDMEDWEFAVEWLGEMLTRPAFLPDDVDGERQIVYEEIDIGDPHVRDVTMFELLYGDHPIGRPIGGDHRQYDDIEREDVVDWYRRHYRAENVVVSWAGMLPADLVESRVEEAFAGLPGGWEPPEREAPDPLTGKKRFGVEGPEGSAWMLLGHHVEPAGARELATLMVLRELIDDAAFDELRTERELTYSPLVTFETLTDAWRLDTYVRTSDARGIVDAVEGLELVVDRLGDLDEKRFERARESVRDLLDAGTQMGLVDSTTRAWTLARAGQESIDVRAALEGLDREAVVAYAAEHLVPERRFLLTNTARVFGVPWFVIALLALLVGGVGAIAFRERLAGLGAGLRAHRDRARSARRERDAMAPIHSFAAEAERAERQLQDFFAEQDESEEDGDGPVGAP